MFLPAAIVIFAGSSFFITRVVMYRQEVSRECSSFVPEIDRIKEAKTVFCHTCECYLYQVDESTYPNMTNSNKYAPSYITQCPNWQGNQLDGKLSRISNDLGCSGWCQQEPIFYFKANDYWSYNNKTGWHHNRAIVQGSCYPKIQTAVDVLTYKMPLAMSSIIVLLYMPILAFLMQAIRIRATRQ